MDQQARTIESQLMDVPVAGQANVQPISRKELRRLVVDFYKDVARLHRKVEVGQTTKAHRCS